MVGSDDGEGCRPGEAEAGAGGFLGWAEVGGEGGEGSVGGGAVQVAQQNYSLVFFGGDGSGEGLDADVAGRRPEAGSGVDADGAQVGDEGDQRAGRGGDRGAQRPVRGGFPLGRDGGGQGAVVHDVDRVGVRQRELAPQADRAQDRVVGVGGRQFVLVDARGLGGEFLQGQDVGAGGGEGAGGGGGVGVGGADVVADQGEVAARVRFVEEQGAEKVHPHCGRQQQGDGRGGGAAVQGPGQEDGDAETGPGQEGLDQAAEVSWTVRDLRVQEQEQAQQQCQRREQRAAPPNPRGLAPLSVDHLRILGSWVGSAYRLGQP
ncbi:hypothetical protein GCM10027589_49530 [Actinocorallia lasiicapitis]